MTIFQKKTINICCYLIFSTPWKLEVMQNCCRDPLWSTLKCLYFGLMDEHEIWIVPSGRITFFLQQAKVLTSPTKYLNIYELVGHKLLCKHYKHSLTFLLAPPSGQHLDLSNNLLQKSRRNNEMKPQLYNVVSMLTCLTKTVNMINVIPLKKYQYAGIVIVTMLAFSLKQVGHKTSD